MSKDVLELKSSVVYFRFPGNISSKWTEIKFLFVLFCFSRKCQIQYVTQYQLLFTQIAFFSLNMVKLIIIRTRYQVEVEKRLAVLFLYCIQG